VTDYIFLMHNDAPDSAPADWGAYVGKLRASGHFEGGSSMGGGECVRKVGAPPAITAHLSGYIVIQANSLAEAKALLAGNPAFEAGGTIEIRELSTE
jgi:hypothetical protein